MDHYSPEDKLFMLYLHTNPSSTQIGIYSIPKKVIAFEIGYSLESIQVLLERFQNKYQEIIYSNQYQEITLLNSLKFSILRGGKPVSDLLIREISKIQDTDLIDQTYQHLLKFWESSRRSFDKSIRDIFEEELRLRNGLVKLPLERDKTINETLTDIYDCFEKDNESQKQKQNKNQTHSHSQYQNQNQESDSDSSLESLMGLYQNYFGKITPDVSKTIEEHHKIFTNQLIAEALFLSRNASHPLNYANKILENWKNLGIFSRYDLENSKMSQNH